MSWFVSLSMRLEFLTSYVGRGVLLVTAWLTFSYGDEQFIQTGVGPGVFYFAYVTHCLLPSRNLVYIQQVKKFPAFIKPKCSPLFNISPLFGH
jgi:hypothetical protein